MWPDLRVDQRFEYTQSLGGWLLIGADLGMQQAGDDHAGDPAGVEPFAPTSIWVLLGLEISDRFVDDLVPVRFRLSGTGRDGIEKEN